jgi:TolA-binding protein
MIELANIYFNNKEWEKAASYYEKARKLNGSTSAMLFRLGECYIQLGNKESAKEIFTELKNKYPNYSQMEKVDNYLSQL